MGRLRETRPNFDYNPQEDFRVGLMKNRKFTRPFVSYSAPAVHFQGTHNLQSASREQGIELVANVKRLDSSPTEGCTTPSSEHSSVRQARGRCSESRCPTRNRLMQQTLQFG